MSHSLAAPALELTEELTQDGSSGLGKRVLQMNFHNSPRSLLIMYSSVNLPPTLKQCFFNLPIRFPANKGPQALCVTPPPLHSRKFKTIPQKERLD